MTVSKLDHVNIRTSNLEGMITFYQTVLGLEESTRPPFPFPGAWLYCGDQAVVHLVEMTDEAPPQNDLTLEHFAFTAAGLKSFLAKLEAYDIPYETKRLPEWGHWQINLHDPDGNHLHVDFTPDEAP